jgi:hypothetical protein
MNMIRLLLLAGSQQQQDASSGFHSLVSKIDSTCMLIILVRTKGLGEWVLSIQGDQLVLKLQPVVSDVVE